MHQCAEAAIMSVGFLLCLSQLLTGSCVVMTAILLLQRCSVLFPFHMAVRILGLCMAPCVTLTVVSIFNNLLSSWPLTLMPLSMQNSPRLTESFLEPWTLTFLFLKVILNPSP